MGLLIGIGEEQENKQIHADEVGPGPTHGTHAVLLLGRVVVSKIVDFHNSTNLMKVGDLAEISEKDFVKINENSSVEIKDWVNTMNAYAEARGPAGRTVGQKAIKPAEPEESALTAGAKRQRVGPSHFEQTKEALTVEPIVKSKWAIVSPISTEHGNSRLDQRARLLIGDLREIHEKQPKLGEVCHTMKNGVHIYLACVHNSKWQQTHGGVEEVPKKRQMQAAALKIKIDMKRRELVQVACPDYAHEKITGFGRNL